MTKREYTIKDISGDKFKYGYKNYKVSRESSLPDKTDIEPLFYIDGPRECVTISIPPVSLRAMASAMIKMADLMDAGNKKI